MTESELLYGRYHVATLIGIEKLVSHQMCHIFDNDTETTARNLLARCEIGTGVPEFRMANALMSLAQVLALQECYEEAETFAFSSYQALQQTTGAMVQALRRRAFLLYVHSLCMQGKHIAAETACNLALAALENAGGPNETAAAPFRIELAKVRIQRAAIIHAVPILQNGSMEIPAMVWFQMERVCIREGLWIEAFGLCMRFLRTFVASDGAAHPMVLLCLKDMAFIYLKQGQLEMAKMYSTNVIALQRWIIGHLPAQILEAAGNHMDILNREGRTREARGVYSDVQDIREAAQSKGTHRAHVVPSLLFVNSQLGVVYMLERHWEHAKRVLRAVTSVPVDTFEGKRRVVQAMAYLVEAHIAQGEWYAAELVGRQVFSWRKENLRPGHPDTLLGLDVLVAVLKPQRKFVSVNQLLGVRKVIKAADEAWRSRMVGESLKQYLV